MKRKREWVRYAIATVALMVLTVTLCVFKRNGNVGTRPHSLSYKNEIEMVMMKYHPLIIEYNERWRPKDKEVRERWWQENIGQPRDAEISELRRKYNRPDFPQGPPPGE